MYEAIHPNLQLASISGGTDIMGCFVLGCPVLPVYAGEIQVRGLGMDVAILNEDGQKFLANKVNYVVSLRLFPCP